jgi:hypothetical protein
MSLDDAVSLLVILIYFTVLVLLAPGAATQLAVVVAVLIAVFVRPAFTTARVAVTASIQLACTDTAVAALVMTSIESVVAVRNKAIINAFFGLGSP